MSNITATLQDALKTNKLNFTFPQINWIDNYIKTSQDLLTQVENLIFDVIKRFRITVIPSLILDISGLIKDSLILEQTADLSMYFIFIKFLLVALIDAGIIPVSKYDREQADVLVENSIDLLATNFLTVETRTASLFRRIFNSVFCFI